MNTETQSDLVPSRREDTDWHRTAICKTRTMGVGRGSVDMSKTKLAMVILEVRINSIRMRLSDAGIENTP